MKKGARRLKEEVDQALGRSYSIEDALKVLDTNNTYNPAMKCHIRFYLETKRFHGDYIQLIVNAVAKKAPSEEILNYISNDIESRDV